MAGDLQELLPDGSTSRRPVAGGRGAATVLLRFGTSTKISMSITQSAASWGLVSLGMGTEWGWQVLLVLRSLTSGSSISAGLFPSRSHTLGSTLGPDMGNVVTLHGRRDRDGGPRLQTEPLADMRTAMK